MASVESALGGQSSGDGRLLRPQIQNIIHYTATRYDCDPTSRSAVPQGGQIEMKADVATPRRWIQLRLSTILLLTLAAALSIALLTALRREQVTGAKYDQVRAENSKLRAEAGYLEIVDPKRVYVLNLREVDDLTWRWKVWLPAGNWGFGGDATRISTTQKPTHVNTYPIAGNREFQVFATVRRNPAGKWQFTAVIGGNRIGYLIEETHRLVAPAKMIARNTKIAGEKRQESFATSDVIELIRLTADKIVDEPNSQLHSEPQPEDNDGVQVWLKRMK